MGERQLSSAAIAELDKDHCYYRAIRRPKSLRTVNKREGDRRVAINSFCDPKMERRSGHDRRK